MKSVIGAVLLITILGAGWVLFTSSRKEPLEVPLPVTRANLSGKQEIIGKSVEGRDIESYTFLPAGLSPAGQAGGAGKTHLLFVGGIHGGYEWNSVLLAYRFLDYLLDNPEALPSNLSVTVIPSLNPDGVYKVTSRVGRFNMTNVSTDKDILASGRFNAHSVDINRNFDCKWKAKSTWQSKIVSAGSAPFSEPETLALRNFVLKHVPDAVVFWHSQANAVYASECQDGILTETLGILDAYSFGSGYPAITSFDAYAVTGDAEGWLASTGIPAITVELQSHETIEWERNLAGIEALFRYYGHEAKKIQ